MTAVAGDRPCPPGDYPVVVVGSGAGALQLSYSLDRLGIDHAVVSDDPVAGGMFRRFPFFQRLLSWTKPYAPAERGTRAYERYDWNSLLGDEPAHRALMPALMDGTSYFPSRPEMERNLQAFADVTGRRIRYGCEWRSTRLEEGPDGRRVIVETSEGAYRAPVAVFAVGVAKPYTPPTPGMDRVPHYVDTRAAESYAGRRVFIVGKQNSGFELASGLLPWARSIVLASPSPAKLSVVTRSLVGIRARYVQPYEDHVLAGGVAVMEAAIERVDVSDGGTSVTVRPSQGGEARTIGVDDVIAATGFTAPLLDLPDLGVATYGQSRLPAQTPYWESATVPGIYFAGTISQGAAGLKKHGMPSNSGAVHGHRFNARILARHLAETRFGVAPARRPIPPADLPEFVVQEITHAPELWHQRAYLARVVEIGGSGVVDAGLHPLAHVLDAGGPDALALTIEADAAGAVYPVIYTRRGGAVTEHALPSDPLHDFTGPDHRSAVAAILGGFGITTDPATRAAPAASRRPGDA